MIVNKYNKGGGSSGVTPEQVQEQINSALTPYWESGITKEYVDSADTIIYASATCRMDDVEQVVSSALNEFHEQIMELSARTPDLSNYWTSAQTEEAITSKNYITSAALEDYALSADVTSLSAATSGKADKMNIASNPSMLMFPSWNSQGIITGKIKYAYDPDSYINGKKKVFIDTNGNGGITIYAPQSAGTAGDILVSTGSGAPVWSAVTFPETKTIIDFDKTPQSERAALYAELKALYDGGSGATINKTYDFYKTVNTWQGQKIDYYTFSGDTLVFGQVVSPENVTDQVVYVQVMEIDSAGNVNVVTNTVGGVTPAMLDNYWTSATTKDYADAVLQSATTHIEEVEEVAASALTELHNQVWTLTMALMEHLNTPATLNITQEPTTAMTLNDLSGIGITASEVQAAYDGLRSRVKIASTSHSWPIWDASYTDDNNWYISFGTMTVQTVGTVEGIQAYTEYDITCSNGSVTIRKGVNN